MAATTQKTLLRTSDLTEAVDAVSRTRVRRWRDRRNLSP
jgi:hypothetical protein